MEHFIDLVCNRLVERGLRATPLQEEWEAIKRADDEERDYLDAAARLGYDGLDPDTDEATMQLMIGAADMFDRPLLNDLLDGVTPTLLADDTRWLNQALEQYVDADTAGLNQIPSATPTTDVSFGLRPWGKGYSDALAFRLALGLGIAERLLIEDFVSADRVDGVDPLIMGLTGKSAPHLVYAEWVDTTEQRFLRARAAWHSSFDTQPHSLIADTFTSRQATGRAFAAEALAPAAGIAQMIPSSMSEYVPASRIKQIADHYNVSPVLIAHQVQNQLGRRAGLS